MEVSPHTAQALPTPPLSGRRGFDTERCWWFIFRHSSNGENFAAIRVACQSMAYHSAAWLETAPTVLPSSSACLMCRFASFSRVKHLREVGPLSHPVMWSKQLTQPVSAPLQSSLRFLPDLLSAPPSVHLAMYVPPVTGGRYGFILFRWNDSIG